MNLHGVECERAEPMVPEAYLCRLEDRNKLALGLLSESKGTRIVIRPAVQHVKGMLRRPHAVLIVESYGPS